MFSPAVIGTAALWLIFLWLGAAIVASIFSEAKGYGDKWGLVTGVMLSVVGAFVWAAAPPREISRWKLHGELSPPARTMLIVVEVVVIGAGAYVTATVDASTSGRVGLVVLVAMVAAIAAAFVKAIDIKRATGGKTMAELRAERHVLDSPGEPS
jgi:hypothetical protein